MWTLYKYHHGVLKGFPRGSAAKKPQEWPEEPQEMEVRSLGQEDPLEDGVATHPVFVPGEFHAQSSLAGSSHADSDMTRDRDM